VEGGGNKYMVAGLPYIWLSWLHFYCEMFNIILAVTIRFSADLRTDLIVCYVMLCFVCYEKNLNWNKVFGFIMRSEEHSIDCKDSREGKEW
jgi:hypothetical protein